MNSYIRSEARTKHCATLMGAACLASLTLTSALKADTEIIRELAKNKPHINIIVSGNDARESALTLQQDILRHPDNKHTPADISILTIDQGAQQSAAGGSFSKSPLVFVLIGKEMTSPLPSQLSSYLLRPITSPAQKISVVGASLGGEQHQQTFVVEMFAPDNARLQRLIPLMLAHRAGSFRDLPFTNAFTSNKLAIFSSDSFRDFAQSWGEVQSPDVWNDIEWHNLNEFGKLTPDQLDERNLIFMQCRGTNDTLPEPAQSVLSGMTIRPTTVVIARHRLNSAAEDSPQLAVISTPSPLILRMRALRYPTLSVLDTAPELMELTDLRSVKQTTLLISGSIPDSDREQVRLLLAKDFRTDLGMNIEERGPIMQVLRNEVTLEQLQGATDTSRLLRRKSGLRYVWHLAVTNYSGTTEYDPTEKKTTPDPEPFTVYEPQEPSRSKGLFQGNKSDAQYDKEMEDYREAHRIWEQKKSDYDTLVGGEDFQWNRQVTANSKANVQGILRLIDLQENGKIVWEHDCYGSDTHESVYKSDHVSLRGPDTRPSSLDAPSSENECSTQLLHVAIQKACAASFTTLSETTLLPTPGAPSANRKITSDRFGNQTGIAAREPAVAFISNGVITLNIGLSRGLRPGSRVLVPLKTTAITDPTTGEVLENRVTDSVLLRVTRCGAVADCVVAYPRDASKLSQISVGAPVRIVH